MKIVLDANIFVSAFIWGGKPRLVADRYAQTLDELFISEEILGEIRYVLKMPKFDLDKKRFDAVMENIETHGKTVAVLPEHRAAGVCRDPADDKYIECALAAGAEYIISGDKDLLDVKEHRGVKIVNARSYLDIVAD